MNFRVFCYKFRDYNRKDLVLNNTLKTLDGTTKILNW